MFLLYHTVHGSHDYWHVSSSTSLHIVLFLCCFSVTSCCVQHSICYFIYSGMLTRCWNAVLERRKLSRFLCCVSMMIELDSLSTAPIFYECNTPVAIATFPIILLIKNQIDLDTLPVVQFPLQQWFFYGFPFPWCCWLRQSRSRKLCHIQHALSGCVHGLLAGQHASQNILIMFHPTFSMATNWANISNDWWSK